MSPEYTQALADHSKAARIMDAARADYRSRKIGDSEFLAAVVAYRVACDAFDAAFAREAGHVEPRNVRIGGRVLSID